MNNGTRKDLTFTTSVTMMGSWSIEISCRSGLRLYAAPLRCGVQLVGEMENMRKVRNMRERDDTIINSRKQDNLYYHKLLMDVLPSQLNGNAEQLVK
jgi:hypothetical protein